MTQYLPPNLLALFAARDPLPYLTPYDKLPHEKKRPPWTGLSCFLNNFEVSNLQIVKTNVEVSCKDCNGTRYQKLSSRVSFHSGKKNVTHIGSKMADTSAAIISETGSAAAAARAVTV